MKVRTPDGTVINFPDTMSRDEIKSVMQNKYPMVHQAQENPPPPTPPMSVPRIIEGMGGAITQGFIGNFGDEAVAAARGLTSDKPYAERLGEERSRMEEFTKEHPWLNAAGNFAGGALGPLNAITRSPVQAGLLQGATGGFGQGEGIQDRLMSAGAGGLLGGAIGGLTEMGTRIGRGLYNLATGGTKNPDRAALNLLSTALERGGTNIDEVATRAVGTRAPMMVADVGDPTQRLARTVTTQPGAGSADLREALVARQSNQPERVGNLIRSTVDPRNANREIDDLVAARQAASRPAYQAAYDVGPIYNDHIARLTKNPRLRQGLRRGMETERNLADAEGRELDISDYAITGFNKAGDPIMKPVPNTQMLDTAKRGLDDMLEEYRDTITGRLVLDNEGRSIDALRRSLLEEMDDLNPLYQAARQEYAGPTQSINAVRAGRNFMKGDIEDVEKLFDDLEPADREFFVTGIAYELRNMARYGTSDTVDATRKILAGKSKERLQSFLGRDAFEELMRELRNEAQTTRTMRIATTGSPTGPILAEQADIAQQENAALGALVDAAALGPGPATANLFRRSINRASGLSEATANALAPRLMAQSPDELSLLRRDLSDYMRSTRNRANIKKRFGAGATAGGYNLLDQGE